MQLFSYIFAGLLVVLSFTQANTKPAPVVAAAPYSSDGNNLKPAVDTAEEVVVPGLIDTAIGSAVEDAPLRDEVTEAIENILQSATDKAADAPLQDDTTEELVIPGSIDTTLDSAVEDAPLRDEITEPIQNAVPYEVAINAAIKKAEDVIKSVIEQLNEQIKNILKNANAGNIGNVGV